MRHLTTSWLSNLIKRSWAGGNDLHICSINPLVLLIPPKTKWICLTQLRFDLTASRWKIEHNDAWTFHYGNQSPSFCEPSRSGEMMITYELYIIITRIKWNLLLFVIIKYGFFPCWMQFTCGRALLSTGGREKNKRFNVYSAFPSHIAKKEKWEVDTGFDYRF